jgi:tetratricopeptide (TPR) repeat protein
LKNIAYFNITLRALLLGTSFLSACSTPKDTAMSRGMQNLTARYNYIYNSNVILDEYEEDLYNNYRDNYTELLPVYTTPEKFSAATVTTAPANGKALDAMITKAQTIIADKAFSNYIDDAYLLVGKAHYFKTNYFIAEEYFDYTAKTYTTNTAVALSALNWKARTLLQLNDLKAAAAILDTVYTNLPFTKLNKSAPLATISQLYIYQKRYNEAIPLLQEAIKESPLKRNRIRWTYILAQLYEQQKDYTAALANYLKVQKSNAGFELYFNANLNRVKLAGLLNGQQLNRKKQLQALLRDDKNLEYIDQIYYQIAESYADDSDFQSAEKNYKRSVQKSSRNNYQKGLSYLKLANLNFDEFKNFLQAKAYFDSTINTLPKTYPGYEQILKKSQNLEYISKRYDVIAIEDTLQLIAKLPESNRLERIKRITATTPATPVNAGTTRDIPLPNINIAQTSGTFYFSNSTARTKGAADFITRWGNRKLEDNWRQSLKSSLQATTENMVKAADGDTPENSAQPLRLNGDTSSKKYLSALPLTPELLTASNRRIIDAYYEIANFYQQELADQEEAVKIYQLILSRFPDNSRLGSIYYGLYLAYKDSAPRDAAKYKKLIVDGFPNSAYAKTILDPDYSAKQTERDAQLLKAYNIVFDQYEGKAFPTVISSVTTATLQYPDNPMNPQLTYLKAIAVGRTQPIDSLVKAFAAIPATYPDDRLIVPLVKDHLAYIATHKEEFARRKVALPDFDANEPRFFVKITEPEKPIQNPEIPANVQEKSAEVVAVPAATEAAIPASKIFSTAISQVYYFVIDVEDATLTLSSSRFGIGQFNRGNYSDAGLRHQLTEFDNDQLIYVGNFSSFAEAKDYADGITPQLKQIMKVPTGIYSSFIISKENFEKLQSKDLVTKYLDFFKNNYQK